MINRQVGGRSVFLALSARAVSLPLQFAGAMFVAAVVVSQHGVAAYGSIAVVANLSTLLVFADLGLGAAVANAVAQGLWVDARPTVIVAVRGLWRIGLFLATGSVAVCALGVGAQVLGQSSLPHGNLAVAAVCIVIALALPLSVGQRILLGRSEVHVLSLIQAIGAPVAAAVCILVAFFHGPLYLFALCVPIGSFTAVAVVYTIAMLRESENPTSILVEGAPWRSRAGPRLGRTARPMLVITLGLPIALQTDAIILSHVGTPQGVGLYTLAAPFYAGCFALVSSAGAALWPLFLKTNPLNLRHVYLSWLRRFLTAGIGIGGLLIIVGPFGARAIAGHAAEPRVFAALALLLVVQAVHMPAGMLLIQPAGLRFQAWCVLAMTVVNLPLSVVLTGLIGSAGPALGSALSVAAFQLLPGVARVLRTVGNSCRVGTEALT